MPIIIIKVGFYLTCNNSTVSENEQLGMAKSDHYDDSGMHETSWTTPVAVSSASSKTESETMTKLAQRENPAILDTINSADEKEPLKLEVHEVSVDNSGI